MPLRISYELDSAYRHRQRARIFGNIDTTLRPLDVSEIVTHELERCVLSVENLFDRDSAFYNVATLGGKHELQ